MDKAQPASGARKGVPVALPARDAVLAAFQGRFVEAQYVWTSFLLDHLIECRRKIGDLDSMMVLIVIGLSALRQIQKVRELEGEHISLSYMTAEVPDGGWRIRKGEAGPSAAATDMAELTASTVARIADLMGRLSTVSAAAMTEAGRQATPLNLTDPSAVAQAWAGPGGAPPGRTGHTLASLQPGLRAEHRRRLGPRGFDHAAALVGVAPAAALPGAPASDGALLLQGMLAEVAAQDLPGPGGAVLGVDLDLHAVPAAEEEVTVSLEVAAVNRASGIARLAGRITGEGGRLLAEGQLRVRRAGSGRGCCCRRIPISTPSRRAPPRWSRSRSRSPGPRTMTACWDRWRRRGGA